MNATQCRMARAALQLGVRELAALARVSTSTLTKFERGEALMPRTSEAIQRALEAKGIMFTSNPPGVTIGEYPSKKRRATEERANLPQGLSPAPGAKGHQAAQAVIWLRESRELVTITAEQIRRARKLLGWTPYRLAPRSGMGHTLLRQLENGVRPLDQESAARLRDALEAEGIEFLDIGSGEGVRLRHCNGEAVDFTNGVEPGVKGNGAK